jgi:hypothetical protein
LEAVMCCAFVVFCNYCSSPFPSDMRTKSQDFTRFNRKNREFVTTALTFYQK